MDFDSISREELLEMQMDELCREYEAQLLQAYQIKVLLWSLVMHE